MKKLIKVAGAIYKENAKWWHFWNPFSGWVGGSILIFLPVIISVFFNCPSIAVGALIYAILSPVFACIAICSNRALDKISTTDNNQNQE